MTCPSSDVPAGNATGRKASDPSSPTICFLGLAAIDNLDVSKYTKIPLTSVDYSKEKLGQVAIDLVLNQIDGKRSQGTVTEIPVKLIVRESTARAGVGA
ncbi:substrate-binding domain-containing protein [Rhizobium leguminosarum]